MRQILELLNDPAAIIFLIPAVYGAFVFITRLIAASYIRELTEYRRYF